MKLISMKAVFGALDGAELHFQDGLNIITAPNGWGKSTWCAFLMAMLYGIDTRERSKQGVLADKEHYAPWSGRPMEGSIRLIWQGRDITLERSTKGRIPMGQFRAYETESGTPIRELNGENCGEVLLGAKRSVYARSGMISGTSIFSGTDEELNRSLRRLITTGDDSPGAARLETQLKELKNKCQYNRTGLIPQAREELERCQREAREASALRQQSTELHRELEELNKRHGELLAHRDACAAARNREKLAQVEQARQDEREARVLLEQAQDRCRELPRPNALRRELEELNTAHTRRLDAELQAAMTLPEELPAETDPFRGMTADDAKAKAEADLLEKAALTGQTSRGRPVLWYVLGVLFGIGAAACLLLLSGLTGWLAGGGAGLLAIVALALGLWQSGRRSKARRALLLLERQLQEVYGSLSPREAAKAYEKALAKRQGADSPEALRARVEALTRREEELSPRKVWLLAAQESWDALFDARRQLARAMHQRKTLELMASGLTESRGKAPVELSLTLEETEAQLARVSTTTTSLRSRLDVCLGQSKALRSAEELTQREQALSRRLQELERWHEAITLALELLKQGKEELQSQFAPPISRRAQELLRELTGGAYSRLTIQEGFTVLTSAQGEAAGREPQWRSSGTRELVYLAVRLAVAELILPEAPMILDDALCRLDDSHLDAALRVLKKQSRQVLLFTCQRREQEWLEAGRARGSTPE